MNFLNLFLISLFRKIKSITVILIFYLNSFSQCTFVPVYLTQTPDCNNNGYVLAFEENFDGSSLDMSRWEIPNWWTGRLQGVDAQEYNTFNNVLVSNGTCKIYAKEETILARAQPNDPDSLILNDGIPNLRPYYYTSGALFSKRNFLHGKFEIRCKLPAGEGFWPAFWLHTGGDQMNPPWNELDIFDNKNHGATELEYGPAYDYDFDGDGDGCRLTRNFNLPDLTNWHTYTCIYDEHKIIWQIDGSTIDVLYKFTTITNQTLECGIDVGDGTYLMKPSFPVNRMNIIMNLAIREGTHAPSSNSLPAVFEIDYVRCWEKTNTPCTGCVDHITFENINQLPNVARAEEYISAGNETRVLTGQDVKFRSPEIQLMPGFSVEEGGNFSAVPQECNLNTYVEDVSINYIGNNAINGYSIDRCVDPIYSIDVTGALYYIFKVKTSPNSFFNIYSTSGSITSNHIDLWNTSIYGGNGTYYTELILLSCSDLVQESNTIIVSSPSCRLADTIQSKQFEIHDITKDTTSVIPVLNKEFIIYPNPAKDQLHVFYSVNRIKSTNLTIMDATGRELFKQEYISTLGPNKKTLDVSYYENGTYFLKLVCEEEKLESKFIIAR